MMHKDHKDRICRDDTEVWIFYPLFQQSSHPYMAEGEEGVRDWDGWMVSPMQWTWTRANSGRWWERGRPGVLQPMGSQESDMTGQLRNNNQLQLLFWKGVLSLEPSARLLGSSLQLSIWKMLFNLHLLVKEVKKEAACFSAGKGSNPPSLSPRKDAPVLYHNMLWTHFLFLFHKISCWTVTLMIWWLDLTNKK